MRYFIFFILIQTFIASHLTFAQESKITIDQFKKNNQQVIEALKVSEKSPLQAAEILEKWQPTEDFLKIYKHYWVSIFKNDLESAQKQFVEFKKQKKYLRLRLELLKILLLQKPASNSVFIKSESKIILKQLRGTSEGEMFESNYLKWLGQNQFYSEICSHERARWISNPDIDFVDMSSAIELCPVKFEDFLTRLRRLIFAAKEFQAQREIEIYTKSEQKNNLEDWQKTYIQAIFDSNVGDPVKAFSNLSKYEKEILQTDFDDNYFYIAQRAGELKKAEALIVPMIQKANNKKKNELRFQRGFLFYQTKQYAKAYEVFDKIYQTHPAKKKKRKNKDFDQIAWLRAWTLFLDQKYEKSLVAFEDTKTFANDTARLNYWIAVNKQKLNDTSTAQDIFKKLAEPLVAQKSFTFYNILAWLRLSEYKVQFKNNDVIKSIISLTKSRNSYFPSPDDQVTRTQLLKQYSELIDEPFVTDEGQIQVVNTENDVLSSEDLLGLTVTSKADLLNQIFWSQLLVEGGQSDLAKWHLFELEKNLKDRKKSDLLVQFYLDKKFYYRALSLQQKLSLPQGLQTQFKSDTIYWSSQYPEAYKNSVQKNSDLHKIDPNIMWSIMRAETQYKADAISPVGAVGLMQFMPYTLQKIGTLLNQKVDTDQLFTPDKSIEFGAAYLKKLSIEMNQQAPLIAASYNGGPHRVKQWIKNLGQLDYDVFIEHIPFAETRTYTKRVLTYRAMYEKIYNGNLNFDKMKYLIEKNPYTPPEGFKLSEEWGIQLVK